MDDYLEYCNKLREFRRYINTIEHMLLVSSKFTRTVEMLIKIVENIVDGYKYFYTLSYSVLVTKEELEYFNAKNFRDKVDFVSRKFDENGYRMSFNDYFFLKKVLISNYRKESEFRKGLSMVVDIDGSEERVNIERLMQFYRNLQQACQYIELVIKKQQEPDQIHLE